MQPKITPPSFQVDDLVEYYVGTNIYQGTVVDIKGAVVAIPRKKDLRLYVVRRDDKDGTIDLVKAGDMAIK